MADVFSRSKRSEVMAAVRSRGNQATELRLITILRAAGLTGWRRQQPLPGRPDFIFRHARVAVFVDGCFWHGCQLHGRRPATRKAFWDRKLDRNAARDREVNRLLRRRGWRVVRIWEHALKAAPRVAARLRAALRAGPLRGGVYQVRTR